MGNLIERLHDVAAASRNHDGETDALIDAADTIERLTARNEVLEAVLEAVLESGWSQSIKVREAIAATEDKDDAG